MYGCQKQEPKAHLWKKESERKAEKGFTKRCGKKKGEYVYGAPVGKLKRVESKKKQDAGIVK
jgi:hypothetical protein